MSDVRLEFKELLAKIGVGDTLRLKVVAREMADHVRIPGAVGRPFVAPDLWVPESDRSFGGAVLLIEAPAAVGKSSMAAQMATVSKNLVWDLSKFKVGSNFFSGLLYDAYGSEGLDSVKNSVKAGKSTLILDAADEALVQAGSQNFNAALENLKKFLPEHEQGRPSVVILGRPDTISDARSKLEELAVRTSVARVAFFSEEQSRRFVELKARSGAVRNIATRELGVFLDDFFQTVHRAFGASEWVSSEEFLGYAPVLDALAKFYADSDNPMRTLSDLRRSQSEVHVWDLLAGVIASILDRETSKFGNSFGGGDDEKRRFGESAYDRKTQVDRLMAESPNEVVPNADFELLRDEGWYEDELLPAVNAQFREHPFINSGESGDANPLRRFSSVVFRDYALAARIATQDRGFVSSISDFWRDSRIAPSPMLVHFAMGSHLGLNEIPFEALAILCDSHSSGFLSSEMLEFESNGLDQNSSDLYEVRVALTEREIEVRALYAASVEARPLEFYRGLARTEIYCADLDVLVGAGFNDFLIGPSVRIFCRNFQTEAREVRVKGSIENPNVVEAERMLSSTGRLECSPSELLQLRIPKVAHPWYGNAVALESASGTAGVDLLRASMEVRRNTRWYVRQSTADGALNYPIAAMDTIIDKRRASADVHDFLKNRGYLTAVQSSYVLQFPGFNARTVVLGDLDNSYYVAMLEDYLAYA